MKNITGFKANRHKTNPLERELHNQFKAQFLPDVKKIIYRETPDKFISATEVNDHQKRIILTIVQWFGTPIGQNFYNQVQADLKKKKECKIST